MLSQLYTFFFGLMIAAFVAFGIAAFYPAPSGEDPKAGALIASGPLSARDHRAECLEPCRDQFEATCADDASSAECEQARREEKICMQTCREERNSARVVESHSRWAAQVDHSRDVSILAMTFAIAILGVGLKLPTTFAVISDGTIVGGILTLGYGILSGFLTHDALFRFITVAVGLPIVFLLGYRRFVRHR